MPDRDGEPGIGTAVFNYDCDQEDEVDRYRGMLDTQPGLAVVGLKRSALGVRFLIGRWERLLRLIKEEGTLYGNDRNEAINYQGARATNPEDLFQSEGAYLTWIYCLMCQPEPKDEHFVALGNEHWMPASLMDRGSEQWLGDASLCKKLLEELAERELAYLRPREERLRRNYEDAGAGRCRGPQAGAPGSGRGPAAAGGGGPRSPVPPRLPRLPEGARLAPRPAGCRVNPRRTCTATADDTPTTVVPESMSVEQGVAQRKQEAAALAPGGENGIGPPIPGETGRGRR